MANHRPNTPNMRMNGCQEPDLERCFKEILSKKQKKKSRKISRKQKNKPSGKISEALIKISKPWIDRIGANPPLGAMKFSYEACGLIWNVSRLSDDKERQDGLNDAVDAIAATAPDVSKLEISLLVEDVYDRALDLYPEDPRIIMNIDVEDLGDGKFHVLVASAR